MDLQQETKPVGCLAMSRCREKKSHDDEVRRISVWKHKKCTSFEKIGVSLPMFSSRKHVKCSFIQTKILENRIFASKKHPRRFLDRNMFFLEDDPFLLGLGPVTFQGLLLLNFLRVDSKK